MAARPVKDFVHARRNLLPTLALIAAACLLPATPAAFAAEDQKVWRALTEEDRRGQTPTAVPAGRGGSAAPASRDSVLVHVAAGIVAAVVAGMVVAALAAALRPRRQAPAKPRPAGTGAGNPLERLWSVHLTRKRRERGPTV